MPDIAFTGVRIPYSDLSGELDPHNVYETRAKWRSSQKSNGLERFAYMVFGPSFIGSLAFALNPYVSYEFPTMRITPTNRTRKFSHIGNTPRSNVSYEDLTYCQNSPDLTTPALLDRTGVSCTTTTTYKGGTVLAAQAAILGFVADTTVRTRSLNSKGGEFELFSPTMSTASRSSSGTVFNRLYVFPNGPPNEVQVTHYKQRLRSSVVGPYVRVSQSKVDANLASERVSFGLKAGKYALGMLADSLPTTRTFSLARSIGELKDLPMLLKGSLRLIIDSQELLGFAGGGRQRLLNAKTQGSQYLNIKFGWEPLIKDIRDMLALPEQITKEVNRLIDRKGLPTVFRSTRKGVEELTDHPFFGTANRPNEETYIDGAVKGHRSWKLRTACTYTLRFPQVDIPILRQDLLDKKWGANPNPTDVYNLVPWTWLVDWFSGLGQYVDLMNTLASDKSLFNFGYLTYVSNGEYTIDDRLKRYNKISMQTIGPDSYVEELPSGNFRVTQEYAYKYQKRIDISNLEDVIVLSRPSSLRADQSAILGALLAKFASS